MCCTKWHLTKSIFELLKKLMLYRHCLILFAVRVRVLVSLFLTLRIDVLIHSVRCCSFSQRRINRKLRVVGAFYRTTRGWGSTNWLIGPKMVDLHILGLHKTEGSKGCQIRLHLMTWPTHISRYDDSTSISNAVHWWKTKQKILAENHDLLHPTIISHSKLIFPRKY